MGIQEGMTLLKRWGPFLTLCLLGAAYINGGSDPVEKNPEGRELKVQGVGMEEEAEIPDLHLQENAMSQQPQFFNIDTMRRLQEETRQLQSSGGYDTSPAKVSLPTWTSALKDIWSPVVDGDTPFLWAVPRTGAIALNDIFTYCLGLSMANHRGAYTSNKTVGVYEYGGDRGLLHHPQLVNVRTHTVGWINECEQRDVIGAQITEMFISPLLTRASEQLFRKHKARAFVMMRNPVKRIIDEFYMHQHATHRGEWDIEKATLSLVQYASSEYMVENFVTRSLLKKEEDFEITTADMAVAKEILRTKFIVGIHEWFDISVLRFERYFGYVQKFDVLTNLTVNNCHFTSLRFAHHIENRPFVPDSETTHEIIYKRNWADLELYHYAKNLFADQEKLLPVDEQ